MLIKKKESIRWKSRKSTLQTSLSMFFLFKHFPQIVLKISFLNSWELNGAVNGSPIKNNMSLKLCNTKSNQIIYV